MKKKAYYTRVMTLEDVALELGVSKERVRQIEEAAIRKLKKVLHSRSLTGTGDIIACAGDLKQ